MYSLKYCTLLLTSSLVLFSCGSSSSGPSTALQANTSMSEASSMFGSMSEISKMKSYLAFADTKVATNDLSAQQQDLLKLCQKTVTSNGDPNHNISQITIGGSGCPISYSLNSDSTRSGSQSNAVVQFNYRVVNANFASITDIQAADCTANVSVNESSQSSMSISGHLACQIDSKSRGIMHISLNLKFENSASGRTVAMDATLDIGGKVAIASVTSQTPTGGATTNVVLVNGQASTENIDLSSLSPILSSP